MTKVVDAIWLVTCAEWRAFSVWAKSTDEAVDMVACRYPELTDLRAKLVAAGSPGSERAAKGTKWKWR